MFYVVLTLLLVSLFYSYFSLVIIQNYSSHGIHCSPIVDLV